MMLKVKIKGGMKAYDLFQQLDAEDFITDLILTFGDSEPEEATITLEEMDLTDPYEDSYCREYHPLY